MISKRACLAVVVAWLGVSGVQADDLVCWFAPGSDAAQCRQIAEALSKDTGVTVAPRVATKYPEILTALSENKP